MEKGTLGVIILLLIGVVVVAALLPEIGSKVSELSEKQTVSKESISIASTRMTSGEINSSVNLTVSRAPTAGSWEATNCPLTGFILGNNSKNFTSGTDYIFSGSNGKLAILNSVNMNGTDGTSGNTTTSYYTWCAAGYAGDSGSRSVAKIILIFAALGLIGFVIYQFGKSAGWIGT